jgi:hypothetical protein
MAWTTVETPNAKYILVFSGHGETIPYFPSEFDALVLEHGENKNSIHFQQFGKLVEQAAKGNKQVWMADTPVNKKELIRSLDSRGNVRGIEEFQETLKPQNSLKSERMQRREKNKPINRRKFLAMILRRKRV